MKSPSDPLFEGLRAALDEPSRPADDAHVERAIARATQTLAIGAGAAASGAAGSAKATGAHVAMKAGWLRLAYPLAAAASVSAAAVVVYMATRPEPASSPAPLESTSTVAPTPSPAAVAVPEERQVESPTVSVDDLPAASAKRTEPSRERGVPAPPSNEPVLDAAELFRQANAERRAGGTKRAEELYRSLLSRYPTAPESRATHVSLGRLLLDQKGDARGALAEFDAYLKGAGDETLDEEARVGRALAFQKLGNAAEERRAWQELMAHHPGSLQATRAKRRLDALGPSSSGTPDVAAPRSE